MASAHLYTASNVTDQSPTGAANKTIIQLVTGATRKIWVKEIGISFRSVTATDVPVLVFLARQSTAGTASALSIQPANEGIPAAISTAQDTFTVEPTTGVICGGPWEVTPIGGLFVVQWQLGDEPDMAVSSRLALIAVAAATQTCRAYIKFNE